MPGRLASVVALCASFLAGYSTAMAAGQTSGAPVVASCANPRLPPELVEGAIAPPASPLPIVTGVAPKVKLRLAVAANEENRMVGLMCVLKLRPSEGMIFVFPRDDEWDFWMKNTLVPLDMIWLDSDGTITTVAANVPSSTLQTPDAAVARRDGHGRFVIELRAGEAAREKLVVGTRLQLPPLQVESP
jgi:uncharacterized membrane protein (UPF0127 family)